MSVILLSTIIITSTLLLSVTQIKSYLFDKTPISIQIDKKLSAEELEGTKQYLSNIPGVYKIANTDSETIQIYVEENYYKYADINMILNNIKRVNYITRIDGPISSLKAFSKLDFDMLKSFFLTSIIIYSFIFISLLYIKISSSLKHKNRWINSFILVGGTIKDIYKRSILQEIINASWIALSTLVITIIVGLSVGKDILAMINIEKYILITFSVVLLCIFSSIVITTLTLHYSKAKKLQ